MNERDLAARLALYLVADPDQTPDNFLPAVETALANGVTTVQLRTKRSTDRQMLDLARSIGIRCRAHGAAFLVNDRVDIALAAGADGVHLGVDDLPVEDARRLLGPNSVIGYSPETDAQTQEARQRGADYLGVGPVITTASKDDAGQPIGFEGLRRRAVLAGIPVIGIGGITPANYADVLATSAVGAAVISAILRAPDPGIATRAFVEARERTPV